MKQFEVLETGKDSMVVVKWIDESNKDWKEFGICKLDDNGKANYSTSFKNVKDVADIMIPFNEFRDINEKTVEWCSVCGEESELDNVFKPHVCKECGEQLLPCNMCFWNEYECGTSCPLSQSKNKVIENEG